MPKIKPSVVLNNPRILPMLNDFRYVSLGNQTSSRLNILQCVLIGYIYFKRNISSCTYKQLLVNKKKFVNQKKYVLTFLKQNPHLCGKKGLDLITSLQTFFEKECRIIVFNTDQKNNIVFKGNSDSNINVYLCEKTEKPGFYDVVKKPGAHFGYRSFCSKCIKFTYDKKRHYCVPLCSKCGEFGCTNSGYYKSCADCNRFFLSNRCFNNHKQNNTCKVKKKCNSCKIEYRVNKHCEHECVQTKCERCKIHHELGRCFVLTGKESTSYKINVHKPVLYFDIETMEHNGGNLEPILLVAYFLNPGTTNYIFKSFSRRYNVVKDFIDFLFQYDLTKKQFLFNNYICMAHNFKGFDGVFIMNELHNRPNYKLDSIYDGTKLHTIFIHKIKIKFLDSLNFVKANLRSMSKMFGQQQTKSFFPYDFITPGTLNYIGKLPDKSFYSTGQLTVEEHNDFDKFYDSQKQIYERKLFDLRKVLLNYCKQDCIVLMKCM